MYKFFFLKIIRWYPSTPNIDEYRDAVIKL